MYNKYILTIIKRNWKLLLPGIICIIIFGIIIKNVGGISYEEI